MLLGFILIDIAYQRGIVKLFHIADVVGENEGRVTIV